MRHNDKPTENEIETAIAIGIVLLIFYLSFYSVTFKIISPLFAVPVLIGFVAVCSYLYYLRFKSLRQKKDMATIPTPPPPQHVSRSKSRNERFRPRRFFHPSEEHFYFALSSALFYLDKTLIIAPKIGLWAAVENVTVDDWNKISQKHIDFGIFDPKRNAIILCIELDGSSHDTAHGRQRDRAKNEIL